MTLRTPHLKSLHVHNAIYYLQHGSVHGFMLQCNDVGAPHVYSTPRNICNLHHMNGLQYHTSCVLVSRFIRVEYYWREIHSADLVTQPTLTVANIQLYSKNFHSPGALEQFFNRGIKVKNKVLSCNMIR